MNLDVKPYVKKVEKPWGYELHFTKENLPYMLKLIHINAGKRLSLQMHDKKHESWVALNGDCRVYLEDKNGNMLEIKMEKGASYTCAVGQKHRLAAGEIDAEIIEASTPEIGTTFRIGDDFNRPDETEDVRKDPNRGWNPS